MNSWHSSNEFLASRLIPAGHSHNMLHVHAPMFCENLKHNIALNNGNTAQCELAAFVCCADETAIQAVSEAIKNLRS